MPTNIAWTDETWNVAVGCVKVSQGCAKCYMIRDMSRKPDWKNVNGVATRTKGVFTKPYRLKEPMRIFTCSLTDLFLEQLDSYRWEAFEIMMNCPHHQFQILTKRIERLFIALSQAFRKAVELGKQELAVWLEQWITGKPPKNVWIGVSVACDEEMHRVDELEKVPAAIKFVSFEPLIAPISNPYRNYIDWIIIGGESGPRSGTYKARPCELDWIADLIYEYENREYFTAIFVKQFGSVLAHKMMLKHNKGEDPTEWPKRFQRQDFPVPRFTLPEKPAKGKTISLF